MSQIIGPGLNLPTTNIKKLSGYSSNSENYFYTSLQHGAPGQSWAAKPHTLQCLTVKEAQPTGLHTVPLEFNWLVRIVRICHSLYIFIYSLLLPSLCVSVLEAIGQIGLFASYFRSLQYHDWLLFSQVLLYIRALLSRLSIIGHWIHWSFDGLVSAASLLLQQDPSPARTSRRWIFRQDSRQWTAFLRHLERTQHFSPKTLPMKNNTKLRHTKINGGARSNYRRPRGDLNHLNQKIISCSAFRMPSFGHFSPSFYESHRRVTLSTPLLQHTLVNKSDAFVSASKLWKITVPIRRHQPLWLVIQTNRLEFLTLDI